MRVFAVNSEALMPGDPSQLANAGLCVVEGVAVTDYDSESGEIRWVVHYSVRIGNEHAFAGYSSTDSPEHQLQPTPASWYWDLPERPGPRVNLRVHKPLPTEAEKAQADRDRIEGRCRA